MRKVIPFLIIAIALWSCNTKSKENNTTLQKEIEQSYYNNPILAGWYPDPSITDDGKGNYYLVNSTFSYFPGIPIFHSTDLVNWKQIGNVLDRPEQLELEGLGMSRGIFAPDISYDNGIFYLTCTVVDGKGNFVVTAENPAGPWSNPTYLPEVNGIDPALFFDDDKSYIIYNSDAPDNKPLYQGHRTIRMFEFDKENLKVVGKNRILINGGVDISKKPVWIEGPRMYKLNGYYYLMAAEGGTSVDHSEVILRNKNINDEFIPYKDNPILTQRQLDPNRKDPITSAGHADLIQTKNGEWYGVFLATRDYENDHYNTGRETFLAPVKWVNDWPIFDLDGETIKYQYPLPKGVKINKELFKLNGNFTYTENFDNDKLGYNWMFLRTPKDTWYSLEEKKGYLTINTRPETLSGIKNPSFIGHRQQHLKGSASVAMDFSTQTPNESAGLVAFQNEAHFYYLCKSIKNGNPVVELIKGGEKEPTVIASVDLPKTTSTIQLKIEANVDTYNFSYAIGNDWKILAANSDGKYLSTKVAGGFVGVTLGMYTTSNGKESINKAYFDSFTYTGNDAIYEN
ncbi:glycoside hydrolase family 43 protein [Aureibaculum sp. A20]|uniref:Glycoside hydrolase family 43 protein n=1 Tax=Aureibaculum flavum TaxID=2795986 RepID=A0ABS0WNJ5_9FLAO|nr:glycoside hydrolase family 43 protein [Aureibaculum flavum]MBJ2173563.1 glycoside hydrolase family 43 protein [Aureibaculum flavum]